MIAGAALFLFLMVSGCGTGGCDDNRHYTGTPKGTYNVRIDAKSGTMTVSTTLQIVVNERETGGLCHVLDFSTIEERYLVLGEDNIGS